MARPWVKPWGELVHSDDVHPVPSGMRNTPPFCANKASCAQNAGSYLQAIAPAAGPRGRSPGTRR
jgi:hypothetical protein